MIGRLSARVSFTMRSLNVLFQIWPSLWPTSPIFARYVPGILDTPLYRTMNISKYIGSPQSLFFIATLFQRGLIFFFSLPLPCARNPSWRKMCDGGLSGPPERHISSLKWIGRFALGRRYGPCPCTILARLSVRDIFKTQGSAIYNT